MRLIPLVAVIMAMPVVTTANAQQTTTCEAGQRLFEHALLASGPVCVPEHPQRIAFIDANVGAAVELGVPSITRSYYSDVLVADFPGIAPHLDPATTTDIGNTWEMSGEPLLAAQPDLVVTASYWDVAIAFAERIAPTVVINEDNAATWRDVPRMIAALLRKDAEQAALEADVDARVAAFKAALDAAPTAGRTFTFTQVEDATSLWTFTMEAFGAEFASTAGMQLAATIPAPEDAAKLPDGSTVAFPVSLENLATIDADHIFLYANLGSDPEAMLRDNTIFQHFAAERPGRVHFITGEYWFRNGAMAAHRIIDDLYRAVLDADPAEVSPNPMAWTYETGRR